jgi:hypothetical protein
MKRTIIAVLFASLSLPVLAADIGAPYEQTVQDMQLPSVQNPAVNDQASSGSTSRQRQVVAGPAQPIDPRQATGDSLEATGPWANDPNFIAPPQ